MLVLERDRNKRQLAFMNLDDDPLQQLRATGENLPDELWERLVRLGPLAIPQLIEIVADEDRARDDSPGSGWPPIHAVDVLVELGAVAAAPILVARLKRLHPDDILLDRIVSRLPELGSAVLECALEELAATSEPALRLALCEVLARLGENDERVWSALVQEFETDAVAVAPLMVQYGDGRALPLLSEEIDRATGSAGELQELELQELEEAYDKIVRLGTSGS